MTTTRYRKHHLWPVLDDDTGKLDYWDVHHPDDPHGEGDPIAEGFGTLAEAKAWLDQEITLRAGISLIDDILSGTRRR